MFQSIKNMQAPNSSLQTVDAKYIEDINKVIDKLLQKLDQIKTCKADVVEQYRTLCEERISLLVCEKELDKPQPEKQLAEHIPESEAESDPQQDSQAESDPQQDSEAESDPQRDSQAEFDSDSGLDFWSGTLSWAGPWLLLTPTCSND